jgi:hypothetical protein
MLVPRPRLLQAALPRRQARPVWGQTQFHPRPQVLRPPLVEPLRRLPLLQRQHHRQVLPIQVHPALIVTPKLQAHLAVRQLPVAIPIPNHRIKELTTSSINFSFGCRVLLAESQNIAASKTLHSFIFSSYPTISLVIFIAFSNNLGSS